MKAVHGRKFRYFMGILISHRLSVSDLLTANANLGQNMSVKQVAHYVDQDMY